MKQPMQIAQTRKRQIRTQTPPVHASDATIGVRVAAVRVLVRVSRQRCSLDSALTQALANQAARDRALLQALCYGTLRWYVLLDYLLVQLLKKPLKAREHELKALLLIGLFQLIHLRIPAYAAVSVTVATARELGKSWATGLVNGVLRTFIREQDKLMREIRDKTAVVHAHPKWLLQRIKQDWPDRWESIITANNVHPPFSLRVNQQRSDRANYLKLLAKKRLKGSIIAATKNGIVLDKPCEVMQLPGFTEGLVSVQDGAAQLAASLLALTPGLRILDACAAPGGKTCHILEQQPTSQLLALDISETRLNSLRENLHRLGLAAQLRNADAAHPELWSDNQLFDRILLDVPCTGSGVIRRHPDIKLLRKNSDIERLQSQQINLLRALWPLLRPGGRLVYATCSIFKAENSDVIQIFTSYAADADIIHIDAEWGRADHYGRQILPGNDDFMDGFYYACLQKQTPIL